MKQILTVFKFELSQKFKEKSFYVQVILTGLLFFAATFLPALIGGTGSDGGPFDTVDTSNSEVVDMVDGEKLSDETIALFIEDNVDPSVEEAIDNSFNIVKVNSRQELDSKVNSEEVAKGYHILTNTESIVVKRQSSFTEFSDNQLTDILEENYRYNIAANQYGINAEELREIDSLHATANVQSLGKNPIIGYILSYVVLFFLYFMIIFQGQSIATNVAKEKDNRTMELLITNVKAKSMIWGKVLSGVAASLFQVVVVIVATAAGFLINKNSSYSAMLDMVLDEIKLESILILLGFMIFGVIFYYLVNAALGSLVSRLDEMNQALMPAILMIMAAFMIPMFSMTMPDGIVMRIASLVPFTSPLAMFARYQMTVVPLSEVLISFGILVVSTLLMGILATKIYRNGTLNYGNRMNLWKAITTKTE